MTSEYLLDAIGLLDDDLIQEAEVLPDPKVIPWRRWGARAACLALALTLGYGMTHLSMNSASTGAACAPSCSGESSAAGAGEGTTDPGCWDNTGDASPAAPSGSSDSQGNSSCAPSEKRGTIYLAENTYRLLDEVVDGLPEGSREFGVLSALSPDAPFPATDNAEFVGASLFQAPDGLLYVQLLEGGYAVAESFQP